METTELISLISSISSLAIALLAIWLALHHKREADSVNEKTRDLLVEVRAEAIAISNIAMPELERYGETMRRLIFRRPNEDVEEEQSNMLNTVAMNLDKISSDLETLRAETDLSKIRDRIDELEGSFSQSQEMIKERAIAEQKIEIETDFISIDLNAIDEGIILVPIWQFSVFQSLLDSLYVRFLKRHVGVYTYEKQWILVNKSTGKPLKKKRRRPRQTLEMLNVGPGDELVLKML